MRELTFLSELLELKFSTEVLFGFKALPKFTEDPTNTLSNNELCVTLLSELVLSLERMADRGAICGPDRERLFEIVEKSPHHQRSVCSLPFSYSITDIPVNNYLHLALIISIAFLRPVRGDYIYPWS